MYFLLSLLILGFCGRGSWVPIHLTLCTGLVLLAMVEAYLHAKFHLDLSNRLATPTSQTHRTGQDNGPIA